MIYTILYGHGSTDDTWLDEFESVRTRVAALVGPDTRVRSAFLEFVEPDLVSAAVEAASDGATGLIVVPVFLFAGRHLREDVPARVEEVRRRFEAALADERAARHAAAPDAASVADLGRAKSPEWGSNPRLGHLQSYL